MNSLPSAVFDHASDPQNRRTMKDASAVGKADLGGRPPEVVIYLKVSRETVTDASFEAHGCGYTIACCSVLTELAKGKSLVDCVGLKAGDLHQEIGELPRERQFCATLAVEALQAAVRKLGVAAAPKED